MKEIGEKGVLIYLNKIVEDCITYQLERSLKIPAVKNV